MTPPHVVANTRTRIVAELIDSEKRYRNSLNILQTVIAPRIRIVVDFESCDRLFSNLNDICRVSDVLLEKLCPRFNKFQHSFIENTTTNCRDAEFDDGLIVGDLLLQVAPFLKLYTTYYTNFSSSLETTSMLLSTNLGFQKSLKDIQSLPEIGSMRFDAFLILPVQRIPRYVLLIDDLLKNTTKQHPDYYNLVNSRILIGEIASFVNDRINQHQMFQDMLHIQRSLIGFNEVLIVPGRRLLFEGKVTKVCRRNDQVRHLFVFSDVLIYTMPVLKLWMTQTSYIFHRKIYLDHCAVRLISDSDVCQNAFQILSPEKSFAAYTETRVATEKWVSVIADAIQSLRSSRSSLQIEHEEELEYQAPVWLPNKFATSCMICNSQFGFLSRKHHCRICGSIICADCSANTFTIPGLKLQPPTVARACDQCANRSTTLNKGTNMRLTEYPQIPDEDNESSSVVSFLSSLTRYVGANSNGVEMARSTSNLSEFAFNRSRSYSQGLLETFAHSGASAHRLSVSNSMSRESSLFVPAAKCVLCLEVLGIANRKCQCASCMKDVCRSCSRLDNDQNICDACFRGVPAESVVVNGNGGGWSFILEE